jgi:hypothetical protein
MSLVAFLPFLFYEIVWRALVLVLQRSGRIQHESVQSWVFLLQSHFFVIDLFKLFASSWLNFGKPYAFGNLSVSSGFSCLLQYKFSNYSLTIIWISLLSIVLSSFSSLNLLIWVFSLFLLVSLAICQPYFFKEPTHHFFDL